MMKLLSLAVLALAASQVSAYCPNLCSGHGTCGVNDECTCYQYVGTARGDFYNVGGAYDASLQAAYTGADCSLRTCPEAFSWSGATPNGLSVSASIKEAVASAGAYSFKIGATADLTAAGTNKALSKGSKIRVGTQLMTIRSAAWSSPDNTITTFEATAAALATTDFVYYGAQEIESSTTTRSSLTANGAHSMLECAGQGICDRATGNCECFPGYEGEACTRSVCPNDCSGNGICLAAYRLAADADTTYQYAWDNNKHFGCKCDLGFRGPDCSLQECPSDYDPLFGCGGGICNTGGANNGDGSTACANENNSDCAGEQRDCSGRGLCDYESGTCKCFSGFFGEACEKQTILI